MTRWFRQDLFTSGSLASRAFSVSPPSEGGSPCTASSAGASRWGSCREPAGNSYLPPSGTGTPPPPVIRDRLWLCSCPVPTWSWGPSPGEPFPPHPQRCLSRVPLSERLGVSPRSRDPRHEAPLGGPPTRGGSRPTFLQARRPRPALRVWVSETITTSTGQTVVQRGGCVPEARWRGPADVPGSLEEGKSFPPDLTAHRAAVRTQVWSRSCRWTHVCDALANLGLRQPCLAIKRI